MLVAICRSIHCEEGEAEDLGRFNMCFTCDSGDLLLDATCLQQTKLPTSNII